MNRLKFNIETIPNQNGFEFAVNSLYRIDEYDPDYFQGNILEDEDSKMLFTMVSNIVREHVIILASEKEDFALGTRFLKVVPSIFPTQEALDDLYKKVFKAVTALFNKDYYLNYKDKERVNHVFTFEYEIDQKTIEVSWSCVVEC